MIGELPYIPIPLIVSVVVAMAVIGVWWLIAKFKEKHKD